MTVKAKDYDEIVRVIQLYLDGFNNNDISLFKEAFHEDAWIPLRGRRRGSPQEPDLRIL